MNLINISLTREKLLSNENYVNKAPAKIVDIDYKKNHFGDKLYFQQ